MPPAKPTIDTAVQSISELFARDVVSGAKGTDGAGPPDYDDEAILETIIDCTEEYAVQNHRATSEALLQYRQARRGAGARAEASPLVASVTSALAAAFCDRYLAHTKDHEKNKEYFAKEMMKYAYSQNNASPEVEPQLEHDHMHSHFEQVYDMVWRAMHLLSAGPFQGAEAYLNPESLWHLNSKGSAKYADGPMPQLIKGIDQYTGASASQWQEPGVLPRSKATKQINDVALASMALLDERDRGLAPDPYRQEENLEESPGICTAQYYEGLDTAKTIKDGKVIEKMIESWEKSRSKNKSVPAAKDQLLLDTRDALVESILRQVKKDMKARYPYLSDKQLDYAVTLPASLRASGADNKMSMASTIRGRVDSVVTKETIDGLMDNIQSTAKTDIDNVFAKGQSSNILNSVLQRSMTAILKALAELMDKITRTDRHEVKFAGKAIIRAENKLLKDAMKKVVEDELPLPSLSGKIKDASAEVVGKVEERKERQSRR